MKKTNREFYLSYLSKCVEAGLLEPDEIEGLTDEELKNLAGEFMDKADNAYDQYKEQYGDI